MKENKNRTELTDEQLEEVSGGGLTFSGSLAIGGGKYATSLDQIEGGTEFWGYFDDKGYKRMRRNINKTFGFDGVTVFDVDGANVYYPKNGAENHSIVV